jgi:hypothetical protein
LTSAKLDVSKRVRSIKNKLRIGQNVDIQSQFGSTCQRNAKKQTFGSSKQLHTALLEELGANWPMEAIYLEGTQTDPKNI